MPMYDPSTDANSHVRLGETLAEMEDVTAAMRAKVARIEEILTGPKEAKIMPGGGLDRSNIGVVKGSVSILNDLRYLLVDLERIESFL